MLVRFTCALVAGLGFLAGFLLGARFVVPSPLTGPGLERSFAARQAPSRARPTTGRPAAATDGPRPPRKPVKTKPPSGRRKKNR